MTRFSAQTPVEEYIRTSNALTGSSRVIHSEIFPPQPLRPNPRLITPKELGFTNNTVDTDEMTQAMKLHNVAPANISELLQLVDRGLWDGYSLVVGLGQIGREILYGKIIDYVPVLWGTGAIHHVQTRKLTETWSYSDHFLVVNP